MVSVLVVPWQISHSSLAASRPIGMECQNRIFRSGPMERMTEYSKLGALFFVLQLFVKWRLQYLNIICLCIVLHFLLNDIHNIIHIYNSITWD